MSNIQTLSNLTRQDTNPLVLEWLQHIQQRYNVGNHRLPIVENRGDSTIIDHLNNNLSETQIRDLMRCILDKRIDQDLLLIILKTLPTDFVSTILNSPHIIDTTMFDELFLNTLLLCSFGIGDFNVTWSIIKTLLIGLTTNQDESLINISDLINNLEEQRAGAEESVNERNAVFQDNITRMWSSWNWAWILRRSVQLGTLGAFAYLGTSFYAPLLAPLGLRVADGMSRAVIQQNTNVISRDIPNDPTVDTVISAFSNAFTILKIFIFGKD